MTRDLTSVVGSALVAIFNPTLLAAVTLMLVMDHPKRLMLGYLLGAYTISIGVGMAFVFGLHNAAVFKTQRHTLSPGADILIGSAAIVISRLLFKQRDAPVRRWRADHKARRAARRLGPEKEAWHVRMLSKGSAKVTFVVGFALSLPGVSYLNALEHIDRLNPGPLPAILLILFFCAMQQLLLEAPLVAYAVAPDWTPTAVNRARAWLHRKGRGIAVYGLAVIGALLIARGLVYLL